jgi:hypothetical protein
MLRLPVLSFDTTREVLRLDEIEDVRRTSTAGDVGSDSSVLRLDDDTPWAGFTVRTEVERCGNSVLDESALDVLMSVSFAPCLERGGGGGDLAIDSGSLLLGFGLGRGASTEC